MNLLRSLAVMALLVVGLAAHAQSASKPSAECEALARAALPVAREMLRTHGEFAPFGVGMTLGNEVVDVQPEEARERSQPGDAVSLLRNGLAQAIRSGQVRATALVYEARLILPSSEVTTDAIAMALNHRDSYSAVVVFPYEFEAGELKIGAAQIIEQKGLPRTSAGKRRK